MTSFPWACAIITIALSLSDTHAAVSATGPDYSISCRAVLQQENAKITIASAALALPPNDKRRVDAYEKIIALPSYTNSGVWATCDHETILAYNLSVILRCVLGLELPSSLLESEGVSTSESNFVLDYGLYVESDVTSGGRITPEAFRHYLSVARDGYLYFHEPVRCAKTFALLQRWLANESLPDLKPTAGYCPVIAP